MVNSELRIVNERRHPGPGPQRSARGPSGSGRSRQPDARYRQQRRRAFPAGYYPAAERWTKTVGIVNCEW